MNVELKRRFANNFTFLASYTWSHSIDDSSDLQTLLIPQDVDNFDRGTRRFVVRPASSFCLQRRFDFAAKRGAIGQRLARRFFSDFTSRRSSRSRRAARSTSSPTSIPTTTSRRRPTVRALLPTARFAFPGTVRLRARPLDRRTATFSRPAIWDAICGITHSLRFGRSANFAGDSFRRTLPSGPDRRRVQPLQSLQRRLGIAVLSRDVNAFGQRAGNGRYYSRPTAAYDPRQFQFGAKFNF